MPHKCKETKRVYNKAYYQANRENIKARQSAYNEANREKIAVKKKAYQEANREKIAVKKKAYYQANKEKLDAKRRAYVKANKDKIDAYYQDNKEKIKAKTKVWRKANKEKHNANVARHRAVKRKQIPKQVSDCLIENKRLRQIYKLCHIFTKATGVQHHVDHMWPLDKDGPHWSGNLQIITATENLTKSTKLNKNIKATIQEMLKDIKYAY